MNAVPFLKMHGLGNDFVVIDARTATDLSGPHGIAAPAARRIADRRRGVGCDQLITLEQPPAGSGADLFMRIRNPDGSEAQACGNATRCVGAIIMDEIGRDRLTIQTLGGLLRAERDARRTVTVDMGPAYLDWNDIPVALPCDTLTLPLDPQSIIGPDPGDADLSPWLTGGPVGVGMGNPHAVFLVEDVGAVPLDRIGPRVETHPLFPERTNVEFVQVMSRGRLRMRVWERAAGITQACGSGACAALVAAVRRGVAERTADVVLDGGTLTISWREDGHVMMSGPVATSFSGTIPVSVFADASDRDEEAAE